MAEATLTFSSASDSEPPSIDRELLAKQEEVEKEKAKALKRRKTLQTYVLLGQMENMAGIFSSPVMRPDPLNKRKSTHRVLRSIEEMNE